MKKTNIFRRLNKNIKLSNNTKVMRFNWLMAPNVATMTITNSIKMEVSKKSNCLLKMDTIRLCDKKGFNNCTLGQQWY